MKFVDHDTCVDVVLSAEEQAGGLEIEQKIVSRLCRLHESFISS